MQVIGEDGALVRAAVAVGVLEDDEFVVRLVAGINVRVGGRATDPQSPSRVPAHLNGAGQFREIGLGGEQCHIKSRVNFELAQLSLGRKVPIRAAALLGRGQRWHVRVIDLRRHLFACRDIPDALIAIGGHDVEIAHCREEIEIAVATVAPAGVVKRVHRPESAEELFVLLQHRCADFLVDDRSWLVECRIKNQPAKQSVTGVVEMTAVEREVNSGGTHRLDCRIENVDETDLLRLGDLAHCEGVEPDVFVVFRSVDPGDVFTGDWREQHELRSSFAVESLGLGRLHKLSELGFEFAQAVRPRERFIESVRRKYDVGLDENQMLICIGEVGRARLVVERVRRPREIAHRQPMSRVSLLNERLEVSKVL